MYISNPINKRFPKRLPIAALLFALLAMTLVSTNRLSANSERAMNGNELALYVKPSVVRILDGYAAQILYQGNNKIYTVVDAGLGSGVFISSDGHILTNAHVVRRTKAGEAEAKKRLGALFFQTLAKDLGEDLRAWDDQRINEIAGQAQFQKIDHINKVALSKEQMFTFEIHAFGNPVSESSSEDVAVIKIEATNTPILKLGNSDKVQDQDHISVVGYPGAGDSPILNVESGFESSITDGKISAHKNARDGLPILQTDAASTHGNSGGPVVNDQGEIIGLLTFGGGQPGEAEVSGFAFIVPISTAMKYVSEAGVNNQESAVDISYRQGLDYYFAKHYSAAIEKFRAVKQLFPAHTKVHKLIEECNKEMAAGNDIPLPSADAGKKDASAKGQQETHKKGFNLVNAIFIGGGLLAMLLFGLAAYQKRESIAALFKKPLQQAARVIKRDNQAIASASQPRLRGVAGCYAGEEIELDGNALIIGRDPRQAQLVIPAIVDGISSRHCRLRFDAARQAVLLEDCESTNGTFLASGERLQSGVARALQPGERFYLSDTQTMFELKSAPESPLIRKPANRAVAVVRGLQGALAGQQVELNGLPVFIGRDPNACQLIASQNFDEISKRHCSLRFDQPTGSFWLEDFGSTNGTFVINGGHSERLGANQPRQLIGQEKFYVGDPQNLFEVRVEER